MDWLPLAGGRADLTQQIVVMGETQQRLTTKERDVLVYLAANHGRTVTRDELLVHVWRSPAHASNEPVYSVIKRLRAKIDRGPHRHIVSVHGDGYRWAPPPDTPRADTPRVSSLDLVASVEVPLETDRVRTTTRFFGRHDELSSMLSALGEGVLLVSLVGPGGAGKTRCAKEILARRPGVFCDLSSSVNEATLVATIAAALELPLEGTTPAEWARGVGRALGAAPDRLVVLDNAEHVIDLVAALVKPWLSLRPTLLVTSREPLRVQGERVVFLGPLPRSDALALLSDRIVEAGGETCSDEVNAVIVDRVDRLPLAIELAAAQVPFLGARALIESLDAQLATLVAGGRDAPLRHATLRAAVEWSWTLLSDRERDVLVSLAVFAGSFSAEGARAVVASADAVAVIASLCSRCQVRRDLDRFALYTAVRELAIERAGDRHELYALAERRHAELVLRVTEAAVTLLEGPRHGEGASVLASELAELRVAWTRWLDRDAVLAAKLALVLERALGLRAERASARREVLSRSREAARQHHDLVLALLIAEGCIEGAPASLLDEALATSKEPRDEAAIRLARGERLASSGLDAARVELERALDLATSLGLHTLRRRALASLGEVFWAHGLVTLASERLRAALDLHVESRDRRAIARTAACLAHVDRIETGGGAARDLLRQAHAAAVELGDPVVLARVLLDLGQHLTRTGDQVGARDALANAGAIYERVGFARDGAFLHLHLAETLVGIGDFDAALEAALEALVALPDPNDVARSTLYEAIGCIHLLRSDLPTAARWIDDGLSIARVNGAARSECTLLGKRGLLHLARNAPRRAYDDFSYAAQLNEQRGSLSIAGSSFADRAMAAFALGRDDDANRDLSRARDLLHDPAANTLDGRMLAGCEIIGRAFGAVRSGASRQKTHADTRARTAAFFDVVPRHEWDVVLRLLDWLIDRIADEPTPAA